jgi:hypothetical protein
MGVLREMQCGGVEGDSPKTMSTYLEVWLTVVNILRGGYLHALCFEEEIPANLMHGQPL